MWRGLETDSRFGYWGTPGGNGEQQMCVQRRLACSVGDSPTGEKVRTP